LIKQVLQIYFPQLNLSYEKPKTCPALKSQESRA